MIPAAPLIIEDIVKSGSAAPSGTLNVRVAPNATGAFIVAVVAFAFAVMLPASVKVPEPVIEVPVMFTDPTEVIFKAPKLRVPLLIVRELVIAMELASVTVLFPAMPELLIVRLFTVAGRPNVA